jgi:opacity protein-like surface antigen
MVTLLLVLIVLLSTLPAYGFRFSVGGFGGFNFPVAQDDATMGTAFGAKVRIPVVPYVGLEPNFMQLTNGDAEVRIESEAWNTTMEREAGKFTSFGVDVVFGSILGHTGLNVYGIAGLSSSKYARETDAIPDLTEVGFWTGIGLDYAINEQVALELRGKLLIFPYDDGPNTGSRKNGMLTVGISYFIGQEGEL